MIVLRRKEREYMNSDNLTVVFVYSSFFEVALTGAGAVLAGAGAGAVTGAV